MRLPRKRRTKGGRRKERGREVRLRPHQGQQYQCHACQEQITVFFYDFPRMLERYHAKKLCTCNIRVRRHVVLVRMLEAVSNLPDRRAAGQENKASLHRRGRMHAREQVNFDILVNHFVRVLF